jgi:catechol 2,3-dioxygenase-like lactoylglutathione lyase family enzyme
MASAKKTTGVVGGKSPSHAKPAAPSASFSGARVASKHAARQGAPAKPGSAQAARSSLPKGLSKKNGKDLPHLFRIHLEVGDLDAAERFYSRLLGVEGRKQAGGRVCFTAGAVTLQVVDVSATGQPHPGPKSLAFLVRDLDPVFERAKALGCLSREVVHGQPGGEIRVRPGGERSFYAQDRWKNPLCFVQQGTAFTG